MSPSMNFETETDAHADIPKLIKIPTVLFKLKTTPNIPSRIIGKRPYPKMLIIE